MQMKRIVILGAAESGVGAAVLAKKEGFDVFVSYPPPTLLNASCTRSVPLL